MKKCKICGELFQPSSNGQRICRKDHYVSCPICGEEMIWNTTRKVEPCSKECKKEATRRMYIEKYGVDHPMKSKQVQTNHKNAMLEKYGVESPLQNKNIKQKAMQTNRAKFGADWAISNREIREAINATNLQKYGSVSPLGNYKIQEKSKETLSHAYGTDNAMKSVEIQARAKATCLKRYNVDNPMKCKQIAANAAQTRNEKMEEITEKIRQTFIEKYNVTNPMYVDEFVNKLANTMMRRYGVKSAILLPEFRDKMINTMVERYGRTYFNPDTISKANIKIHDMLEENGIASEYEFRIENYSYDLHILNTNILLEIDPTYTHNSVGNHWGEGLSSDYHLKKTKRATDAGYRCIHIFDWDNIDQMIALLQNKKVIYGRETQIAEIDNQTCKLFEDTHHLQGYCNGQTVRLGLYNKGELIQVMTFGKPRYNKNYDCELLRLCTHSDYRVVGGTAKLFKYATRTYHLSNIISYCDKSKFTGDVYQRIGMNHLTDTEPQKIWSKKHNKITSNLLRARGYDQLFGTDFGKGTSNEELMLQNGWLPVYDCGQSVFEYKQT